ncbi:MAG: hypothetical protein HY820_02960 [Acidobacteria bacterium]|nr:hypothetical protein [Acidobacteriota bacterium]
MNERNNHGFSVSFESLNDALGIDLGIVSYQEPGAPFRIDAVLDEWRIPAGSADTVHVAIASGCLDDADKGAIPIAGEVLALRLEGERVEPLDVLDSGLSELQRIGLLDAVATHLDGCEVRFALVTVEIESRPVTGFMAVLRDRGVCAIPDPGAKAQDSHFDSIRVRTAFGTFHVTDANQQGAVILLLGQWIHG